MRAGKRGYGMQHGTPQRLSGPLWLGLLIFGLSGALLAGETESPTTFPNVVLITVDTLRADALGWIDPKRSTPTLDKLAREGFSFPAAVTPVPLTQPAHASLLTGLLPRHHGVRTNGRVLGAEVTSLAETLRDHGYATAAFVSGYPLSAVFGFDRGFEHYDDTLPQRRPQGQPERRAEATTEAAMAWLRTTKRGTTKRQSWFVWLHYYDAHDPYDPPAGFHSEGSRGAYDGEVRYIDHAIGTLRAFLSTQPDQILTILTADHGESLGEHGEQTHGFFLYEAVVRVPLVVHWPGHVKPGSSREAVRLYDVFPTVSDLLGLPLPANLDGVSIGPLLAGDPSFTLPPAYLESQRPWLSYGWAPLAATRDARWKLIRAPTPELYDLVADPGETTNLATRNRRQARRLEQALNQIEASAAQEATSADDDALATLRALGYVDAGQQRDPVGPTSKLADPKDKVATWNALSEALAAAERGQLDDAIDRFDAVLETEPNNPFALARSAAALLERGDTTAAFARFEQVLTTVPEDNETRQVLAAALQSQGHFPAAADHWMELARRQPRRVEAWVNLATCLGRSGRTTEAIQALTRAVEIAPERNDLRRRLEQVQAAPRP